MRWLLFAAIGVGTLLLRASFILGGRAASSERFASIRRFVPVAVLTALVVPALVPRHEEPILARTIAASIAALIAYRFNNMLATVAVGIVALLLLR